MLCKVSTLVILLFVHMHTILLRNILFIFSIRFLAVSDIPILSLRILKSSYVVRSIHKVRCGGHKFGKVGFVILRRGPKSKPCRVAYLLILNLRQTIYQILGCKGSHPSEANAVHHLQFNLLPGIIALAWRGRSVDM